MAATRNYFKFQALHKVLLSELVYTSIDEARLPPKKESTEIKEDNKVATTAKIERIASKESAIYDNIAQL